MDYSLIMLEELQKLENLSEDYKGELKFLSKKIRKDFWNTGYNTEKLAKLSYNDVSLRKIKNMLDEYEDTMASQMIEEIMKEPDALKKYQNKKKLKKKVKKLQLRFISM